MDKKLDKHMIVFKIMISFIKRKTNALKVLESMPITEFDQYLRHKGTSAHFKDREASQHGWHRTN